MTDNDKVSDHFRPATLADTSILIVDDSADIRMVTSMVLEGSGFTHVHFAEDGADALQVLHDTHIDLVISDIQMPRLDGISFLRQVKADAATHDIPVILTSGAEGMEELAFKNGADAFVAKPADIDVMIGMVTRLAQQSLESGPYDDGPECPTPFASNLERRHS